MGLILNGSPKTWGAVLIATFLLLLTGIIGAGSMPKNAREIEVTGRLYIMGNEPFTQVAIQTDDNKIYALIGRYETELRALQGKVLAVRGHLAGKTPRGAEAIEVESYKIQESR